MTTTTTTTFITRKIGRDGSLCVAQRFSNGRTSFDVYVKDSDVASVSALVDVDGAVKSFNFTTLCFEKTTIEEVQYRLAMTAGLSTHSFIRWENLWLDIAG